MHTIITFGPHTRSNYIVCCMPSSPLGCTHGRTTSGMACHHRPCHDPPDTQVDRDPSRQPAPCARGTDSPKRPAGKGAGVQAGSRQRVRRFSRYRQFQQLQSFYKLRPFQQLQHVGRRQVPALEGLVQGLWNVGQTREKLGVPFLTT